MVDGTTQHVELLLMSQLDEVDRISRDADGELGILLGMLHGINQQLTVKDIHVEMMTAIGSEVAIHQIDQIGNLSVGLFFCVKLRRKTAGCGALPLPIPESPPSRECLLPSLR